jgi:RIO-like serine/threonine protein kinase
MAKSIKNCTRVDYNDYRNFQNLIKTQKHEGFVDGDLIESLSDMGREKITSIISDLSQPPNSELKGSALRINYGIDSL